MKEGKKIKALIVLSEALKKTFKPVKYCYYFFNSQLTGLIQNKRKYFNIKAFYKTHGVYLYKQWNYFLRGYMDNWRSGDFRSESFLRYASGLY